MIISHKWISFHWNPDQELHAFQTHSNTLAFITGSCFSFISSITISRLWFII